MRRTKGSSTVMKVKSCIKKAVPNKTKRMINCKKKIMNRKRFKRNKRK